MKANNNVSYVDFQKKKNVNERDIYNTQYDKWINIKRACDPSKTIVHEAISYIAAIEFLFLKNPDEIIFNSNLLKKKSHHEERQRGRFLKQIADLYDIEHHTSYDYKGKKHHFVFSAKRTKNSLEILENPELFYSKMAVKNDLDARQICQVCPTNLSVTYIVYRNIKIKTDLKDLVENQNSNLNNDTIENQQDHFKNGIAFEATESDEMELNGNRTKYLDKLTAKTKANREDVDTNSIVAKSSLGGVIFSNSNTENIKLTAESSNPITVKETKVISCQEPQEVITQKALNITYHNKYLKDFVFTQEIFNVVRQSSNKPHFSNDQIFAIARNIVVRKPETRIFGGKKALINYMVKALNNEKEYTHEEIITSVAERNKKEVLEVWELYNSGGVQYF